MAERFIQYAGGNARGTLLGHPDFRHVRPGETYPVGDGDGKVFDFEAAVRLVNNGKMKWVNEAGKDMNPRFNDAENAIITRITESDKAAKPVAINGVPIIATAHKETAENAPNTLAGTGLAQNASTENLTSSVERSAAAPGALSVAPETESAAATPGATESGSSADSGQEGADGANSAGEGAAEDSGAPK